MKALYLNENSVLPHVGCKAVSDGHDRLFSELNVEIVHRFNKNDLWFAKSQPSHQERVETLADAFGDLIRSVDAVIVNGEGTLHHNRGEDLMAFVDAAQNLGRETIIINALIQDMDEYSTVLRRCDTIITRDPISRAEAERMGVNAHMLPDSFVLARFDDGSSKSEKGKIIVTDFLGTLKEGPGQIVDRLLMNLDTRCHYLPMQSPIMSAQWRSVVGRMKAADCVVSARHHGCYAAAMAGSPFVVLASNSHKMEAFRQIVGEFVPFVTDYDNIHAAIEQARDHRAEYARLPEKLNAHDCIAKATSIIGRRKHEGFGGRSAAESLMVKATSIIGRRKPSKRVISLSAETRLEYAICLLEAKHRRDPRFLPLRQEIFRLAKETDTFRNNKTFWDKLFSVSKSRAFLLDELAAVVSEITDRALLGKLAHTAGRATPQDGYYSLTLALWRQMDNRIAAANHLRSAIRSQSYSEAAELFERFESAPADIEYLLKLALPVMYEAEQYKEVVAIDHNMCAAEQADERTRLKIADAHFRLGRYRSSTEILETIKADQELSIIAKHRLGRLKIHMGEFEGWDLMNRVVEREHFVEIEKSLGIPRWQPGMRDVTRLMCWFHDLGGLGGEILWGRLLRAFQSVFQGHLILVVDERLVAMFAASFPHCTVLPRPADMKELRGAADAFIFGREITKLVVSHEEDFRPIATERMHIPKGEEPRFARRINGRPDIAISWKTTNPASAQYRNVPLDKLCEVLSKHDCTYHALQHGDISSDVAALNAALGDRLRCNTIDPAAGVDEIARRLNLMDGIITIDNTTLHIGGAIGIETLALVSVPAYWQWPAEGEWSRWYDTVHLLRQPAPGHWELPLQALDDRLSAISRAP